jgi:hypothetical protein
VNWSTVGTIFVGFSHVFYHHRSGLLKRYY